MHDRPVAVWLNIVALFVLATLFVGGATRITDSGLSITEWAPIMGVIPPLSEAAWTQAFAAYKTIPQYELVNRGMTIDAFRVIYWWEWAHRLIARAIGVVFLIPFVIFWWRGMLATWFKPWGLLLLALGALQGGVGWWMVTSGLTERVDVSQYRLAIHLTLACVILALAVWLSVRLEGRAGGGSIALGRTAFWTGRALPFAILLQIAAGALVAGIDAGLASDSWPLMAGALIPDGLFTLAPGWLNAFENPLTVQFNHRVLGYAVLALGLAHWLAGVRARASIILGLLLAQAASGVALVAWQVPPVLASAHQVLAATTLWLAVANAARLEAVGAAPLRSGGASLGALGRFGSD